MATKFGGHFHLAVWLKLISLWIYYSMHALKLVSPKKNFRDFQFTKKSGVYIRNYDIAKFSVSL